MIKVYINNQEKKILGFTFYLFEGDKFVIDYDKYNCIVDMERYLRDSKGDILGINIERYVSFCECKMKSKTILIEEALNDLKKATKWRANNREKYNDFLSLIKRGENKMKDLVNSQEKENKKKALMMYCMIIDFVNNELDNN